MELGRRGRALWRKVTAEQKLTPIEASLLEEACRIADRLDHLDEILRGESHQWMRLRLPANGDGTTLRIVVSGVLSEARQQAVAYTQIVDKLTKVQGAGAGRPGASRGQPVTGRGGGAGGVADLTSRIASRRAGTAG